MAKHKKTREQKKKADLKRQEASASSPATGSSSLPTFSLDGYQFTKSSPLPKPATPTTYSVTHGLEKSLVVSSVIVILQLAIFFLLTHHILRLPGNVIQY